LSLANGWFVAFPASYTGCAEKAADETDTHTHRIRQAIEYRFLISPFDFAVIYKQFINYSYPSE